FFGKKKSVEELQWNIQQVDQSFENATGTLAEANREMAALNRKLSVNADTGYAEMNRIIGELETVVARTRPETLRPKTEKVLAAVNGMNRFLINLHETAAVDKGVHKLTAANAAINARAAR